MQPTMCPASALIAPPGVVRYCDDCAVTWATAQPNVCWACGAVGSLLPYYTLNWRNPATWRADGKADPVTDLAAPGGPL